jgi:hypothetical protein
MRAAPWLAALYEMWPSPTNQGEPSSMPGWDKAPRTPIEKFMRDHPGWHPGMTSLPGAGSQADAGVKYSDISLTVDWFKKILGYINPIGSAHAVEMPGSMAPGSVSSAQGADKVSQAVTSTGAKNEAATKAVVSSVMAAAAQIVAALHSLNINIDGKALTAVVTGHQANEMTRPPSDAGRFDTRLAPPYPSTLY